MKITVITLYRDDTGKHFVSAVKGTISTANRLSLAKRLRLDKSGDDGCSDELHFCELDVIENELLAQFKEVNTSGGVNSRLEHKPAE